MGQMRILAPGGLPEGIKGESGLLCLCSAFLSVGRASTLCVHPFAVPQVLQTTLCAGKILILLEIELGADLYRASHAGGRRFDSCITHH